MKKSLLTLFMFLAAFQVSAQYGPVDPVSIEEVVTVDGAEGKIEFEAYIEQGYHMYSTDIPAGGPVATSVTYQVVEGAEIVGELIPGDGAVKKMDPVFEMMVSYFDETALFTQKLKFLGGKYHIKGTLRYQSCSDSDCIPGRYDFDITGEAPVVKATPVKSENVPAPREQVLAKEEKKAKSEPVKKEAKKSEPAKTEVKKSEPKKEEPAEVKEAVQPVVEEKVAEEAVAEAGKNSLWEPVTDKLSLQAAEEDNDSSSMWLTFILGFGGGLLALLTPCVWPIIPMTVSFFLKRSKERKQAVREALIYGASIIVIYLALGLAVTLIFGAGALNALSTNAVFNIIFCLMLLVFGASFLGGFELTLPSSWTNKVD